MTTLLTTIHYSYHRFAPTHHPFGLSRAMSKLESSFAVLDTRLANRSYLVGDKYSTADLANFTIACVAPVNGIELERYPNVVRWADGIPGKEAVRRGMEVPNKVPIVSGNYKRLWERVEGFRQGKKELRGRVREARGRVCFP